uniref:Solute carrier family 47 member 3 n=1 Tax=Mastacembelus armatus TaxID=205130 RepID=A0A3Q3N3T5_9TELE
MENSSPTSPLSSWSWVLRQIRMVVPVGSKAEIKELSKLAVPAIMAQFMVFAVSFVSTIFCGHLGRTELAGVSLAIATFGSRNLLRVGIILQRAILILILACFPCWAILINTEPILLAVRQDPEVARLAQMYVKIFMPALPAAFMFSLQMRYLQNQGIIWPEVITGFVVNLLNALINYIVLYVLNLGVVGSAAANTISQFSMVGILYIYIMCKGLHKATWPGWSKECLQDWGSFIHLAIPSMLMLCVEWWTYEIGSFLAGLISEVELGAQSVVYELSNAAYMFPLGFSVAGSIRVGNALGAGETEQAKLSAKLTMFSVLIGSLKDHIASVACSGIIRGAGKQRVGAICNILGYYGVGFPIGVPLMFAAKLGIKGNIYHRDGFSDFSCTTFLLNWSCLGFASSVLS